MTSQGKLVQFAQNIIRFKWLAIIASIIVVMLAGYGAKYLYFSADYTIWFQEDNPERLAFEKLQRTYTQNDNVLFVLQPKEGDVFTPEALEAVKALTEKAWQTPFSIRVDSLTNYQHSYAEGDLLTVEDLVEDISSLTPESLQRIKEVALSEPLLVDRLVSPNGRTTGVNVTLQLPREDANESPIAMAFARQIQKEIQASYPDIKVALTGMIPLNTAFFESGMNDTATLIPMMYGVIILVMIFMLRSLLATVSVLLVITFSVVFAMGIAGWYGVALTPASTIAPTIILTLAIADSIHVLITMFKEMRRGLSKEEAIIESLRINTHPIFITSITTAIGFLSMHASDAPPFHDLGNIAAIGVLAAFVFSVVLLPALMVILPIRVKQKVDVSHSEGMLIFANIVIRYRHMLLWGMSAVVLALAYCIPQIELDDKFIEYFDETIVFRQDSDFAAKELSGSYQIDFSLESSEEEGLSKPEFLQMVEEFTVWLRGQPEVDHVLTISDTFKRLNKNMHGDDQNWYKLPDNKELAAQYLLLYEFSLPYGLDLNNQIDVAKSATRVTVTLKNISTVAMRAFNVRAGEWLDTHKKALASDGGTGPTLMFAFISERNIKGMVFGTLISLVIISFLLIFALKDLKHGLLSLIPNLVPAIMAFGIWGIFIGQVGMGVSVVIAMSLGIIVDDNVHFLSKYLRGLREKQLDTVDAVRYAFTTVGTALIVTSIIIVSGFMVLAQSHFKVNAHMGLLNGIIIAMALVADFLLLPPILMACCRKKEMKKVAAAIVCMMVVYMLPYDAKALTAEELLKQHNTPEAIGLAIAEEADRRETGFKDSTNRLKMILKNAAGNTSVREMRIKTLEVPDPNDGDKSIVVFDQPRDVKGTALLSFAHILEQDDQWLYLPALKRVKRISSKNKSGPFMGSEFAYEDISPNEIKKYDYSYQRSEACGELTCFVIERKPNYAYSGYTKQIAWVDHGEFRVMKIEFYDRKEELLKTLTFSDYKQYLDRYWRAHTQFMENHQTKKTTSLVSDDFVFQTGLNEKDFNQAALKRAR